LEALVEVVSAAEFRLAQQAGADVIGINNRDLRTMEVDLRRTARVLSAVAKDRPVVGLSGVESRADADALFESGCDAILVGGGLMRASDPGAKLEELL
ncbi:MAG TPA: indole-3-glycerol-phosphate synthase TrpC, partial [Burkholderiales bacterium]|nr:indole-3-glycerol-phosphate synthase TrpC [Burkholderiales bacterium]